MDFKYHGVFIELTSHCDFDCDFCVNRFMQRERGFIDPDLFKRIINELSTKSMTSKVLFHIMGEPLLHPNAYELLEYAAKRIPQTCLVINGSLLTGANVERCFRTGITELDISYYASNETNFTLRRAKNLSFDSYRARIQEVVKTKFVKAYRTHLELFYANVNLPAHRWDRSRNQQNFINLNSFRQDIEEWILFIEKLHHDFGLGLHINSNIEEINEEVITGGGGFSHFVTEDFEISLKPITNWENAQAKVKKALIGKCALVLFHEQLGILHNGDVVLCCVDYEGETKVGNVKDRSLTDVLSDKKYKRVVRDFSMGAIPFDRCKACLGAPTYRDWLISQLGTYIYNFRPLRATISKLINAKIGHILTRNLLSKKIIKRIPTRVKF